MTVGNSRDCMVDEVEIGNSEVEGVDREDNQGKSIVEVGIVGKEVDLGCSVAFEDKEAFLVMEEDTHKEEEFGRRKDMERLCSLKVVVVEDMNPKLLVLVN
mmetsp:Transcript_18993/g.25968  ORF Transcript_18993/g.25968 Transcript_18993/m.25968 type:complete len:101 (-) Transcript_18993:132-434(-)